MDDDYSKVIDSQLTELCNEQRQHAEDEYHRKACKKTIENAVISVTREIDATIYLQNTLSRNRNEYLKTAIYLYIDLDINISVCTITIAISPDLYIGYRKHIQNQIAAVQKILYGKRLLVYIQVEYFWL